MSSEVRSLSTPITPASIARDAYDGARHCIQREQADRSLLDHRTDGWPGRRGGHSPSLFVEVVAPALTNVVRDRTDVLAPVHRLVLGRMREHLHREAAV